MSKKHKETTNTNPREVPVTMHLVGEYTYHTVPTLLGFEKLVAVVRDNKITWCHKNFREQG